jgi:release factor glutamine methyltransferase
MNRFAFRATRGPRGGPWAGAGAPADGPDHVVSLSVATLLDELTADLTDIRIQDPRAEARDVIAALCGESRFWPAVHREHTLPPDVVEGARAAAVLRRRGAPFAYAVGRASFRYLTLAVDDRVLIPRQETEQLVELVLASRASRPGGIVVDVGTGSGAIALALASEGTFDRVIATDLATGAIEVARANAGRLAPGARDIVEFRTGSGLRPVAGLTADVIVSNPPYVACDEAAGLPESVRDWEPPHALYGGATGLELTRELVDGAPSVLRPGGLLALESDMRRASQVAAWLAESSRFHGVRVCQDLAGRDRFVLATRA